MADSHDRRFDELYAQHFREVLAYCLRRGQVDDAYDAANEVFAIAWRRIADVPHGDPARPWLYVVAKRVLYRRRRGAVDGDELVGLTEPQHVDDVPGAIEQNLTGVRADYRDRGIAAALKSQAAIWAAQAGYTSIRTQNAQSNAAMLAVNDRLGFERNRATIEYLKGL